MNIHIANNTLSTIFIVSITIIVFTIISFFLFITFIDQPFGDSGATAGVSTNYDSQDQITTIIWVSNHNVDELRLYENGEPYCSLSEIGQSCSIHHQDTTQTITVVGITETGKIEKIKEFTL